MSKAETVHAEDKSNDRIYFTLTPRLVWALCEDPYEYTFWAVVKDIAGEKGECILSREDLATLAMMSNGKASACRDSLIRKRLLTGDFRRDPGYPQPVWHLTVPDFWEANVRWARRYPTIKDRLAFKREQAALKEPSPHDASGEPSPGDEGVSPGDGGIPPGDAKKNVLKNQIEEPEWIQQIWTRVLEQVQSDTPRASFETYIRDTQAIRYGGNVLEILAPSPAAREWCESRLQKTAENLLVGIMNASVSVKFVVGQEVPA